MNKRVKVFSFVLSFIMIVILSVGTTLALLTDTTDPVKNTFTATTDLLANDGTFMIQEHKVNADFELTGELATETDGVYVSYNGVFPGITIQKDPTISLKKLAASAYLYVVVDQSNMTAAQDSDLFNWEIADSWMKIGTADETKTLYVLKDGTGAKALAAGAETNYSYGILKNNVVNVENYGSDVANGLTSGHMIFSAYIVQSYGVDASDATKALSVYNDSFTGTVFSA